MPRLQTSSVHGILKRMSLAHGWISAGLITLKLRLLPRRLLSRRRLGISVRLITRRPRSLQKKLPLRRRTHARDAQAPDEFGPWDTEEDEFGSWVDKREPHHTEAQIAAKEAAAKKKAGHKREAHHTEAQIAAKEKAAKAKHN